MKKSPGPDRILTEMIKHGRFYLVPLFTKLFNNILNSGQFPSIWNLGIIKPIYKKGDYDNPQNYGGITLISCLGKLFTSILQKRLTTHLETNKKLNFEQFGFRPNSQTTDSLFILQQLIHKYLGSKQKIYACFIDYEKAFDTVWQQGLLLKLRKLGITGKYYNIVKSLYENIKSCIQTEQDSYSETFLCNKGIRQGDNLSPTLFSIFMNDIPQFLKQKNCPGLFLSNLMINCLMFADDLVLLSSSPAGLQKSLQAVQMHADQWKLKVNTNKTNIMVFSGNGNYSCKYDFKYNNKTVNIVDKQSYLGLVFTPSGRFTYARAELCKKNNKKCILYQIFIIELH